MSPELNGNPPVLPKRKKNRERKHASTSNIRQEFNVPAYYHCQPNMNIPSSYCSYSATPPFAVHPEPMSLPIFPSSYTHHFSSPPMYNGLNGNGNISHGMLPSSQTSYHAKSKPYLNQNEECMSLPVVKDQQAADDAGQRRFSDPGLPNESDSGSDDGDKQLVRLLTQQVDVLLESHRQLMREVGDLRFELNMLKQQQMHASTAERDYEPGMIADFIKEIREAARMREDALIAKVKHMVEEKQFSANQFQLVTEKTRQNERLAKLEEQMRSLNVTSNSLRYEDNISLPCTSMTAASEEAATQANRQVCELEREVIQLRREVQDSRSRKEDSDSKIHQLERRLLHYQQQQQQRSTAATPPMQLFGGVGGGAGGGSSNTSQLDDKASLLSTSSSTAALDNLSAATSSSALAAASAAATVSSVTVTPMQSHKFLQIGPVTDL